MRKKTGAASLNLPETNKKLHATALFSLYFFAAFLSFSIAGTQISYSFALLFCIILTIKNKESFFHNRKINMPLLLFVLTGLVATVFSLSPAESFYNLREFLLIPIVFLITNLIRTRNKLIVLAAVFLTGYLEMKRW